MYPASENSTDLAAEAAQLASDAFTNMETTRKELAHEFDAAAETYKKASTDDPDSGEQRDPQSPEALAAEAALNTAKNRYDGYLLRTIFATDEYKDARAAAERGAPTERAAALYAAATTFAQAVGAEVARAAQR